MKEQKVDGLAPADGGPAFPIVATGESGQGYIEAQGMTLRDYFAAKAMQACISAIVQHEGHNWKSGDFASEAYCCADAMLKARARSEVSQ